MATRDAPNIIVIFCDNLGYGDLGCYGSTVHRTPALDRMAGEGLRLTSFYVSSGVCTPSRASLLTGCYAQRIDMHESEDGFCVLRPASSKGLNGAEATMAGVLRDAGYATSCVGKWHLGDQPEFLPTRRGFDSYFGIPYSEDMVPEANPSFPPLPLMRGEEVIEAPVDLENITPRYTEEAVAFIRANASRPFLLYLPHATPGSVRVPQVSDRFRGASANSTYGDSVEELDWSTGRILEAVAEAGIDDRTLVIFTSDNGAVRGHGGSNAPLGGWGYSTDEGGMRMPCIIRWPGRIPPGSVCDELCCTMDFLPTFAALARAEVPSEHVMDGEDIGALLRDPGKTRAYRESFFYYQIDQLQAVRSGRWKLCLGLADRIDHARRSLGSRPLALYDVTTDPGETRNVAGEHSEVVQRLTALAERAREELGDTGRLGAGFRPADRVESPTPRLLGGG